LHHQGVRSRADVENVAELAESGLSKRAIARVTGVPPSTVRDRLSGRIPHRADEAPLLVTALDAFVEPKR
jgi:hypothetical protein